MALRSQYYVHSMSITIIAFFSICLSVAAQFLLKFGMTSVSMKYVLSKPISFSVVVEMLSNYFIVGGFAFYALGALLWLAVLSKWEVSKAYPLVGFGFILTALIGTALGENVTMSRVIGILIICAGVLIVSRS
jgi:drug/metabolite transporter (DMT)-like permease